MQTELSVVYLTFDDGPSPEATPFVLDVLKAHGIKATFFVLGKNVMDNPCIVQRLKDEGHLLANHGMEHLNGWRTDTEQYLKNTAEGRTVSGSRLFRPPYGKLRLKQYRQIRQEDRVVFWDVISGDFDQHISAEQVIRNVVDNSRNGSIIVMHDSVKAMKNLEGSLNGIIVELKEKGFEFGVLSATDQLDY